MDYSCVLSRFDRVRPGSRANLWNVRCPCTAGHKNGDRNPSGRLWVDADGSLRWWCAKGCKWKEVLAATGTRATDWFPVADRPPGQRRKGRPMPGKVVSAFDYTDEAGELLYQVCRTDPKGFFQRRPIPGHKGDWAYSLGGGKYAKDPESCYWYERVTNNYPADQLVELSEVRKVPYHLPDLVNPKLAQQPVLIAEGEGKVDLLRDLGFVATCSSGGAGKWPYQFGAFLLGRRVTVFPDMDDVGWTHAHQVVASCMMFGAKTVRVVQSGMGWEKMPPKSDVKDWLGEVVKEMGSAGKEQTKSHQRKALTDLVKLQKEWQ